MTRPGRVVLAAALAVAALTLPALPPPASPPRAADPPPPPPACAVALADATFVAAGGVCQGPPLTDADCAVYDQGLFIDPIDGTMFCDG